MQTALRGFLLSCSRSSGKMTPPNKPGQKQTAKPGATSQGQCGDSTANMDDCFELGFSSVRLATAELMKALELQPKFISASTRRDMYTEWHGRIEEMIKKRISKVYPDHIIIVENKADYDKRSALKLTAAPTWILDPIDGTMNFAHGFPYTCVSLAFWQEKQPEFGIIWNPFLDQCYTARRGYGAFMNVKPLNVSKRDQLSEALIIHELGTDLTFADKKLKNIDQIARKAHGLRSLGSTVLNMCMVAQGFADAYYEFGCHAWDMAAGVLLVQEAGGVVVDPSLQPVDLMSRRMLCASSPKLAQELSALLVKYEPQPRDDDERRPPKPTISKPTGPLDVCSQLPPKKNS
ncbi:inositol monophosphatase 1-like [Drosophila busckii]|uniref:inositol monophosphatase 1-like n=1 Tax=Drosophila busckii TaxID=30019 RepID=UPI00083F4C2A|nr:inositol monophosphatase 1-like [Drosophila busckii]